MSAPAVSILLATYNRADYIAEAIESVLAQTFTDWELLIIDDGSTDATRAVVAPYAAAHANIRYGYQSNRGLAATRQEGVARCRGRYLALLDDDDQYLPCKLERQVAFLDAHPELGLVYSYVDVTDEAWRVLQRAPERPARSFLELIDACTIYTASVLARRACFDRLGSFRSNLPFIHDDEMWLRLSRAYPIAFVPECVGRYRRHATNMTHRFLSYYPEYLTVYGELLRGDLSIEERERTLRAAARMTREGSLVHYQCAAEALVSRQYARAARLYAQAMRLDPLIGTRVPWSRWNAWLYRALKPYAALAYCGAAALLSPGRR